MGYWKFKQPNTGSLMANRGAENNGLEMENEVLKSRGGDDQSTTMKLVVNIFVGCWSWLFPPVSWLVPSISVLLLQVRTDVQFLAYSESSSTSFIANADPMSCIGMDDHGRTGAWLFFVLHFKPNAPLYSDGSFIIINFDIYT
jgi:hypothetical protein